MEPGQVIIRPVVSEKTYVLAEAGKYTFRVHERAHKTQIRQAIEQLFDVTVAEVRTSSVEEQAQAPRVYLGRDPALEEGGHPARARRDHPDLRTGSGGGRVIGAHRLAAPTQTPHTPGGCPGVWGISVAIRGIFPTPRGKASGSGDFASLQTDE